MLLRCHQSAASCICESGRAVNWGYTHPHFTPPSTLFWPCCLLQYAYVIHTTNPTNGDAGEIYCELVGCFICAPSRPAIQSQRRQQ